MSRYLTNGERSLVREIVEEPGLWIGRVRSFGSNLSLGELRDVLERRSKASIGTIGAILRAGGCDVSAFSGELR